MDRNDFLSMIYSNIVDLDMLKYKNIFDKIKQEPNLVMKLLKLREYQESFKKYKKEEYQEFIKCRQMFLFVEYIADMTDENHIDLEIVMRLFDSYKIDFFYNWEEI